MFKSPLIVIAAGALLIGSAGAALAHSSTIGSGTSIAVVSGECGAQGDQQGEFEDLACATDEPGEKASGPNEEGQMEQGAKGATGANGAQGKQSGAGGDEQGQHGSDGESNGDNND